MNDQIVGIIQARMGSTRLPGKSMKRILGKPMLEHIYERLSAVKGINAVIVATSTASPDDEIAAFCDSRNIQLFRGSEEDVLDRFYRAALLAKADHCIRVTADCPFIDPQLIEKLIEYYFTLKYDHCGIATGAGAAKKGFEDRFPDGLDTEIFSFHALAVAWKEATSKIHREHVTPFIWQQPKRFRIGSLKSETDYSSMRWTVDHQEDFEFVQWIYEQLYSKNHLFGIKEILQVLQKAPPEVLSNQQYVGKEHYEQFWGKE